uniref:Chitin-binding type-2 domain-containing protein n=1 Tax=Anopheles atroparvus TaxID=41427 RepID=A0AAG5DKF9_ANOAO
VTPQPAPSGQLLPGETLRTFLPIAPCVPGVTCPSFNCGPILLPHTSCTMFYKCSNGEACEYDCPANLHYNVNEQACDWPERACCDPAVPCQP